MDFLSFQKKHEKDLNICNDCLFYMKSKSELAVIALLAIREVASAASTDKVISPMREAVVDFLAFLLERNFVPSQVEVVIW